MKNLSKYILAALSALVLLVGCDEADGERDYGYGYILMPQAQRVTDYYAVPSGEAEWTYNFRVEDGKLLVYLGVLRSGNIKDDPFSVGVVTNGNLARNFVNRTENAAVMPASIYTLPTRINVEKGSNQSSFYLEVDNAAIESGIYDGLSLVLCVELTEPTRYELSRDAYYTLVVLDVDAIKEFL